MSLKKHNENIEKIQNISDEQINQVINKLKNNLPDLYLYEYLAKYLAPNYLKKIIKNFLEQGLSYEKIVEKLKNMKTKIEKNSYKAIVELSLGMLDFVNGGRKG